jgi:hypothetical protein
VPFDFVVVDREGVQLLARHPGTHRLRQANLPQGTRSAAYLTQLFDALLDRCESLEAFETPAASAPAESSLGDRQASRDTRANRPG